MKVYPAGCKNSSGALIVRMNYAASPFAHTLSCVVLGWRDEGVQTPDR